MRTKLRTSTKVITGFAAAALLALTASSACGQPSYPAGQPGDNLQGTGQATTANRSGNLEQEARKTVKTLKQKNPGLKKLFHNSAGYAVFPDVRQGAVIVGGTHGDGLVYQHGQPIGRTSVTKGSVGTQIGAESFCELIFFQNPQSLKKFKKGNFQFSAGVNAVGANAGVGAVNNYRDGVAVVTASREGLMAKAAIGGQKFTYHPIAMGGAGTQGQTKSSSGSVTNNATENSNSSK